MKFYDTVVLDNITALMKERGKKQKALCEYLGLNPQAFTNWKNGSNDSYMKYLPQISEFFGVTIDYLLGNSPSQEPFALPDDLAVLIATFSEEEMEELRGCVQDIVGKRS